jgi:hypothetical protein
MGPRFNPYSRKATPIQWGVGDGTHVRHDTRLPRTFAPHRAGVGETAPEHAPASSTTVGHASGRSTPGTPSGSSGGSSCRPPTPVGGPPLESDLSRSRRTGAPQLLAYSRGNREVALQIAADPGRRELAVQHLESKRYAASAKNYRDARARLWEDVVTAANLGDPCKPNAQMVFSVVAILRAAGYRAASEVAEQAVLTAKLLDFDVPPSVPIALRDARRASQRGLGPPKKASPIPLERLSELARGETPEHPEGPLWPVRSVTIATWWLLREVEMSSVAQREVTLSPDGTAHIFLSTSKTDPRALGVTRSHKCACGSVPGAPCVIPTSLCPHCTVKEHLDLLASSGRAAPDAPFFPTQLGQPASKLGVVRTIVSLMHRLGLPSHSASGAPLWGGHSMRIGGVQYLGRSGVEVARIQALARHSSNAIHGYLQDTHAKAISNMAAEAGFSRSLASLQRELQSLQTQLNADKPLPPASIPAISTRSVWNPGAHSKLHYLRPTERSLTLCGWKWQHCQTVLQDPPAYVAPACATCRRSYISPASDPRSSTESSDSSSSDS